MTILAYIVLMSFGLPVLLATAYLAVLTVASWRRGKTVADFDSALRVCVVVPAHNEELQVAATVRALLDSRYPVERRKVVVIADNCDDQTARVARAAGAEVHERSDLVERGKGQALDWFFRTHEDAYAESDMVAVIDADTIADPGFLAAMAGQFGEPAVMASQGYYGAANPKDSWRTLLAAAALAVFNHVRPAGQSGLGVSASLKGNGMMMRSALFKRYGWPAHSRVEDLEFYLMLLGDGVRVHYNPEAVVYGEMAVSGGQSEAQRRRWEGGRLDMLRRHGPQLLKNALQRRSMAYFDALMELCIPPLSLLVAAQLLLLGIGLLWLRGLGILAGLCLLVSIAYVASGLLQRRMPVIVWLGLLGAPLFVVWKLLLYLKLAVAPRSDAWERTRRKAETTGEETREEKDDGHER